MMKKILFLVVIVLLTVLTFLAGYYFAVYNLKSGAITMMPATSGQTMELKPGEEGNYLTARIISIDDSMKPAKIVADISLERFLNPPIPKVERTILVDQNTTLVEGKVGPDQPLRSIGLSDLHADDNLLVLFREPITEIIQREYYTANRIKKSLE